MNVHPDFDDDDAMSEAARYRELADTAQDIIYGIDRTGHVSFHNAAATRIIDLGTTSLVGRHYLDLVDERDRERVHRFYLRQMARKIPNTYLEFLAYTPDGSDLWIAQNVRLVIDGDDLLGFHAVARDISERRRVEIALAESEERFRRSFDDAPIGMALVSCEGRFMRVNRSLCEMLGYDEDELLESDFQRITHPDDLDADLEQVQRMLLGDIRSYQLEKRYIHRSGRPLWILLSVSLVRDAAGRPLYFVSQIQDIDERRAMLEELARARDAALESSRMKSAFLANMSHEIRTPMNGIIGLTGLLLAGDSTPEQREHLWHIRSSAESLMSLLSNVLDVAQLEAGRMQISTSSVDVRALVDEVVTAFSETARRKGLELASVVHGDVPRRIAGDAARLRQVLENLVGNALRFTNEGDVVVLVRTGCDTYGRGELRFEVADTGIGVRAEELPRLFDNFTRADESSTRATSGAGLGLAISHRLVQLMGGMVGVDTGRPRGATFWFTIPTGEDLSAPAAVGQVRPGDPVRDAPRPSAPRVLVVDDNPVNRIVTLGQLRQHGLAADVATDGWEALDALARSTYDLILMDYDMPGLDGCETTELIRRYEAPAEHVAIVAHTAYAGVESRERCLEAGMDDFLTKPLATDEVVAIVGRVEAMRRAGLERKRGVQAEPILDLRVLEGLGFAGGERSGRLDDAVSSFVRGGEGRLETLSAALAASDAEEVRRVAHQLGGSARSLGARRLAQLLGELEHWLPERRIEGARFITHQVRRAFQAAAIALERLAGTRRPGELVM